MTIAGRTVVLLMITLAGGCVAPRTPQITPVAARPAPAPPMLEPLTLDSAAQQGSLVFGTVSAGTTRLVKDGVDVPIAPDRRFVIGFGRDHGPVAILIAFQADGQSLNKRIDVAPRQWKIENLPTLARVSQPDAEFQARRPGELAQITAARRANAQSDGWRQSFIWPARGRISGVFGSQRIYSGEPGAPHSGVDVAGGAGAEVIAPADGVVVLAVASPFTLEGNLVIIDHGMRLTSAFLHLSRIDVKAGTVIRQGQRIGAIGQTGRATGPHLHWGMSWNNERVDPQRVAGVMR